MSQNNFHDKLNQELQNGQTQSGNDGFDSALKQAEDKIKSAKFQAQPASAVFQDSLKQKILEARKQKISMKNVFAPLVFLLKPAFYIPAVALVLIVAVTLTSLYLWPTFTPGVKEQSPFTRLSNLLISPAYAQDNFVVEATESDGLGVDSATAFIIKSKEVVDADLLKQNITLTPAAAFEFKKISDTEFKVTPENQLESKTVYNLKIASAYINDAGLTVSRDYSWAFQVKDQFKIKSSLPRHQSAGVPLDTGIEIVFSHEGFTNYEKAVTFEPKISGKFEVHKKVLVFVPKELKPGVIYTVTVNKDLLKVKNSTQTLSENYVFEFETSGTGETRGNESYFSLSNYSFNQFTTEKAPFFEVYRYNYPTDTFKAEVYAFKDADEYLKTLADQDRIPLWASYQRSLFEVDHAKLSKVATFEELKVQKSRNTDYLLLPDTLPAGFYLLELLVGDKIQQAYFQVNDLAVFSAITKTDTLIWVNNVKTKQPLADAAVSFVDKNISAATDASGIAKIQTDKVFEPMDTSAETDFNYYMKYLKVAGDGQTCVLPIYLSLDTSNLKSAGDYWSYFYSDREKYLPNDKVNFWGFIKTRDNQKLQGAITVKLISMSYDYNYDRIIIDKQSIGVVNNQSYVGELQLKNLTPGNYFLEWSIDDVILGSKSISVETYVKPDYNVSIETSKRAVFAGDGVATTIEAGFFDGTPLVDYKFNYTWNGGNQIPIVTDSLGQVKLDLKTSIPSDCDADFPAQGDKTQDLYDNFSCNNSGSEGYYLNVSPSESENEELNAYAYVNVYNAKIETNVDFEANKENKNKASIEIKTTKVDLDLINNPPTGKYAEWPEPDPAPGMAFKAKVVQTDYVRRETGEWYDFINKIVRKTYTYDQVEKEIASFDGRTGDDGKYVYDLDVNPEKSYRVIVISVDQDGRHLLNRSYYYRSYLFEDEYYYRNYDLIFPNDDDGYFPIGATVDVAYDKAETMTVGKNNFLYYTLKRGLLDYKVSGEPTYSFTFGEQHVPNVYIQGVYFDGLVYHQTSSGGYGEKGGDWYGEGMQAKLELKDRNLSLEIKTDKAKYKPGEEATIEVWVKDVNGAPKKSLLNLNVVDEAFYAISNEGIPDPLAGLFASVESGQYATVFSSNLADWETSPGYGGAEKGGCFASGTKITMADGSFKNIEDIQVGDRVLTFNNEFDRQLVESSVSEVFKHFVGEYLIINDKVKITSIHRVYLNGKWQEIGNAKLGDVLINQQGQKVKITDIKKVKAPVFVYNFKVEKYHTYIADGIYVHNDKGGGGEPRTNFPDVALFNDIETNNDGYASVKFTVPDSITSWRVTAQAISSKLYAGAKTANFAVSLPMFVLPTMATDYLTADEPIIKVRAYGDALKSKDEVTFSLESKSLNWDKTEQSGAAFVSTYFDLPALKAGAHDVVVGVKKGLSQDKVQKNVNVVNSRLRAGDMQFYEVKDGLKLTGGDIGRTRLIFSDKNQGQFYRELMYLGWAYGDRIDQKLSRAVGDELRKQYFGDEIYFPEIVDSTVYQMDDGAIKLLPYGDGDLELTAKVAAVAAERFDRAKLLSYFSSIINNAESNREEIAQALWGLASLNEPILLEIKNFAALTDLTVMEKLYISLAAQQIGDSELAGKLYREILTSNGEEFAPYYRIKTGKDQDDILSATILAAIVAGGLNDEKHDGLWQYVKDNYTEDILINLEELVYLQRLLPNYTPGAVKFTVINGDERVDETLERGETYSMSLSKAEVENLVINNVVGNVGLTMITEKPADVSTMKTSNLVSIKKEFYKDGKPVATFNQDDVIEIRLSATIDKTAPNDYYQVTDFIPSGMAYLSYGGNRGYDIDYSCYESWPYEINGQVVKFGLWPGSNCAIKYVSYFVRVVNPGKYVAEPAIIQSEKSYDIKNFSNKKIITIEK
jgi:hypothetical protein